VALGLAADLQGLVSRSIEAFGALGSSPAGLEPAQVAENWRRLIADADDLDVPVPRETLRAAEQIIETASASDEGDEGEAEPDDPGPLDKLADEALIRLLERRVTRKEVALELARRNKVEHLEVLFRAARKMGRADLAQLIPSLLAYGEAAGDYFVEGLASRKSFTRQACAIALGELRLRRAVVPLVHQMLSEKTQVWTEIARALGRYGPGAVKPLQRYLRDPKGREDRLVLAMAFLAVNGAAKQIETLRAGTDADVAALAAQALETREAARIVEEQVDGKRATEEHPAMLRFSRRLYRAIAGEEVGQEEREEMDDQDLAEAEGAEDEASLSTK
jgi:HEAT repeat protein